MESDESANPGVRRVGGGVGVGGKYRWAFRPGTLGLSGVNGQEILHMQHVVSKAWALTC